MSEINNMFSSINEYEQLLESLRLRLHVLNTSIFLLEDKLNIQESDLKTADYIKRINLELIKIRGLILTGEESSVKSVDV
jgi:hypothetical protein